MSRNLFVLCAPEFTLGVCLLALEYTLGCAYLFWSLLPMLANLFFCWEPGNVCPLACLPGAGGGQNNPPKALDAIDR